MKCRKCQKDVESLKQGLCRPCFMVAQVEVEARQEAMENDLPKEYHTPINSEKSTQDVLRRMSEQYRERERNRRG